jgi:hypothetical protein
MRAGEHVESVAARSPDDVTQQQPVVGGSAEVRARRGTNAQSLSKVAQAGDLEPVRSIAGQALAAANKIRNSEHKAWALLNLAQALAETGDTDQALAIADQALIATRTLRDDES